MGTEGQGEHFSASDVEQRLLRGDGETLSDRELLESLLAFAMGEKFEAPREAGRLIGRFGTIAETIDGEPQLLNEAADLSLRTILLFRLVRSVAVRLVRQEFSSRQKIESIDDVLAYCRAAMARLRTEQFRVIFLNTKNGLIADEIIQNGTVNHVAVYPREIIRRALILSASSMILVHNHPSGDPTPSAADLHMTERIVDMAAPFDLRVLDHLIVCRSAHISFRQRGLMNTAT